MVRYLTMTQARLDTSAAPTPALQNIVGVQTKDRPPKSDYFVRPMPDMFALWTEIKAYAKRYAESDRPLPLDAQCEMWLEAIIRSRLVEERLRSEAFEFYAAELCAMIRDFREERIQDEAS
jgi:hypothetical protein